MIINYKIKLLSPILGSGRINNKNTRKLFVDDNNNPHIFIQCIKTKLIKHISFFNVSQEEILALNIYPVLTLVNKDTNIIHIKKKTKTKDSDNSYKFVTHEAYDRGTEFILTIQLDSSVDDSDFKNKLKELLTKLGKFNGISPYGSNNTSRNRGSYGLFTITDISYEY